MITLKSILTNFKKNRRIASIDIVILLRQLAALMNAGIPIIKCFDILEKSQVKSALRLILYSIKRDLLSGKDLFSSLQYHHLYFDKITNQLIKIGEHTGKLEAILITLAENKEKNLIFKKKITQALVYPFIITLTALIVTISMLLFIIPQFSELFSSTTRELPLLTQWIFYFSSLLQHYQYLLFLPLLFFLLLKQKIINFINHLPFIKSTLDKINLARFARNLALTYSAGIPITEALTLIMHANPNPNFKVLMIKLRSHLASGLQLHQSMQMQAYFPDLITQMVKIGEESGMLEHLLNNAAGFFEADIDHFIGQLTHLLEPLIMLVQGVLIGGLVIGMYLPIFKLGSAL